MSAGCSISVSRRSVGELDLCRAAAELLPARRDLAAEAVEEVVGVQRVVVEQQQPLGRDAAGEAERVGQRRVAPAEVRRVLVVGVLAVVDQQRGAARELEAGDPVVVELATAARPSPGSWSGM